MSKIRIEKQLAQKIVEAIYEVCQCQINFINRRGIIIASTDISRIDSFHEAGHEAIKQMKTITVTKENAFEGTKPGVNYPVILDETPIGVIGITGDPTCVGQYGFLATKVTEIFIKEQKLNQLNESHRQQINYVIRSLIYNEIEDYEMIVKLLRANQINEEKKYQVVLIKLDRRYHINNIGLIEKEIQQLFFKLNGSLNTYIYPNEFIGFVEQDLEDCFRQEIDQFTKNHTNIMKIGIGSAFSLKKSHRSYDMAKIAMESISDGIVSYQFFDELRLEMIVGGLSNDIKKQYVKKIFGSLEEKDLMILKRYFENNMNLKMTASELFLHINTLQYKLDRIREKSGLNPRSFQEAVVLYLGFLFL